MIFDYQIFLMDGMKANEAVTENEDGSYTIFVNNHLSEKKRLLAIQHAFNHIKGNDFEKFDVQKIESKTHE